VKPRERWRRPTKRLLLVPLAILVVVVAGTEYLARTAPGAMIDPIDAADLPEVVQVDRSCQRGDEPADIATVADAVTLEGRVTSEAVVDCPQAYDGQLVRFVGEAVGDVKRRRDGAWLLVNDDDYALEVGPVAAAREGRGFNSGLNVWLTHDQLATIELTGGPRARGDIVEVVGEIRRTDPEDGGGLTLRAQQLEVLTPGATFRPPLHVVQAVVAGVLVLLTGLSLLAVRRHRRL
jgi:hypothetical protein